MTPPGQASVTASVNAGGTSAASTCPLVSVVVPVHNGGQLLRESLDSILDQRYPRLEVIVMDDASTDETPMVLASYGDRIRVVRQPETRGIYGNANDGIRLARGEFVGVFHADDVYLPELVERQVSLMQRNPELGAVFAFVTFVDSEGDEFGRQGPLPPEIQAATPLTYPVVLNALLKYKDTFLPTPSALVRTRLYGELGGYRDERYKNTSDLEMWLRIVRSHPIAVLEDHLLRYRRGHGSSSERYHRLRTDLERFFEILDHELDKEGGRRVATAEALEAFEGHRAHDAIACALNALALGDPELARTRLGRVRVSQLRSNVCISRARLTFGLLGLRMLLRLPRASVAKAFLRRRLA